MTKISSASIRLVLKKNRSNSLGENPIYIVVCFGGRKEKSTGVFISERYWNPLREEIRKSCPNAPVLNKMINDIKQRVILRKNEFEYSGKKYTPSMLLEDDIILDLNASSNVFKVIQDRYISEMGLNENSIKLYEYNYRVLKEFFGRDDFLINDITVSSVKRLINSLGLGDNSIRGICGRIASIFNYAIRKGIVESSDYPFNDFVYSQKFKKGNRTYYLDSINLIKLRDWFFDRCIDISGELYSYKSGIEDKLMKRSSIEFSCMFFLASYILNGSSPIDVALLKVDNCSRVTIDGKDYWRVEYKRRKTGIPVVCLLKRDILTMICFERYLGTAFMRNNYIYPVLKDGMSEKQITNAVAKFTGYCSKNLKLICNEINEATVKSNVKNNVEEPLIDVEYMTLYVARHTKANDYLSHPGATLHALATLMGRSANTLATYVHQIRGDKDLAYAESLSSI